MDYDLYRIDCLFIIGGFMKKRFLFGLVFIFILLSCENLTNLDSENEKESKAVFSGDYYYEHHWKAEDGINETNHWYKMTFSDYTSLSEEANGSFIYAYKYRDYFSGQGWTYNDDWDEYNNTEYNNWSSIVYLYQVNDLGQFRTCVLQTVLGDWSEWSNYTVEGESLTLTINGVERTYSLKE